MGLGAHPSDATFCTFRVSPYIAFRWISILFSYRGVAFQSLYSEHALPYTRSKALEAPVHQIETDLRFP